MPAHEITVAAVIQTNEVAQETNVVKREVI